MHAADKTKIAAASNRRPARRRRRGLAPLELVLWLPVLLFVVALIINYSTMATWRLRGEIVSHDAAFRARLGRDGYREGRLLGQWPLNGGIGTAADAQINQLDDPVIQHEVVRGPVFNDRFIVRPVLDPDRDGAYRGVSSVAREFPLMPTLGDYASGDIFGPILDRKWNNDEMGITNEYRRIRLLYQLPSTPPEFPQAFNNAVVAVLDIYDRYPALAVLDADADFLLLRGSAPDFHPRVQRRCSLDREFVQADQVNRLVDTSSGPGEISQLPRTMTDAFLYLYSEHRRLQRRLQSPPPLTAQQRARIMRRLEFLRPYIPRFERHIRELETYRARLP